MLYKVHFVGISYKKNWSRPEIDELVFLGDIADPAPLSKLVYFFHLFKFCQIAKLFISDLGCNWKEVVRIWEEI